MLELTTTLILPSPAKLNLFLHICGRLDNGYHQLQTLFQLLDYGDELEFEVHTFKEHTLKAHTNDANDVPFVLNSDILGLETKDNLIYQAAQLLLPLRKNQSKISVTLHKKLPLGGGIGGGSSNAATALLALNKLWECDLPLHALAKLGLKLGADVPVFVNGKTAFATGVGEQLQSTELEEKFYLVATPKVHISTAEVFAHPALPRNTPMLDTLQYEFDHTRNDCEILVCNMHSQVASLLQWLLHYAPSRMTGTGASVFAVFPTEAKAQKVLRNLPNTATAFVAKGVNQSPLHAALENLNYL